MPVTVKQNSTCPHCGTENVTLWSLAADKIGKNVEGCSFCWVGFIQSHMNHKDEIWQKTFADWWIERRDMEGGQECSSGTSA